MIFSRLKHEVGLRKHLMRHKDDYVNCPICKKVVQNKQSLNSHIRRVHGERRHRCTLCDKLFKTPKNLKVKIQFSMPVLIIFDNFMIDLGTCCDPHRRRLVRLSVLCKEI